MRLLAQLVAQLMAARLVVQPATVLQALVQLGGQLVSARMAWQIATVQLVAQLVAGQQAMVRQGVLLVNRGLHHSSVAAPTVTSEVVPGARALGCSRMRGALARSTGAVRTRVCEYYAAHHAAAPHTSWLSGAACLSCCASLAICSAADAAPL